jgi:hypothetical protein
MTSKYYRLMVLSVVGFLAFGAVVAFYGYENTIYPLDKAVEHKVLSRQKQWRITLSQ